MELLLEWVCHTGDTRGEELTVMETMELVSARATVGVLEGGGVQ